MAYSRLHTEVRKERKDEKECAPVDKGGSVQCLGARAGALLDSGGVVGHQIDADTELDPFLELGAYVFLAQVEKHARVGLQHFHLFSANSEAFSYSFSFSLTQYWSFCFQATVLPHPPAVS